MIILGINWSHDAGAAIIKDGKIISAVNEERYNRVKMYWGFPKYSINEVMKLAGVKPCDINYVALSNLSLTGEGDGSNQEERMRNIYEKNNIQLGKKLMYGISKFKFAGTMAFSKMLLAVGIVKTRKKIRYLKKYLKNIGIKVPLVQVEHHRAHAASAFLTSGFANCLTYTCDFMGDFICATVSVCNENGIRKVHSTPFYHSPAMVYLWITKYLGFVPGKHEGKISGLAAYSEPVTYDKFVKYLQLNSSGLDYQRDVRGFWYLNAINMLAKDLKGYNREQVAAGLQKRFEEVVSKHIQNWLRIYPNRNVALAGGIFANVRLNQEILNLPEVDKVFIHPHMSDGGLAVGAALSLWMDIRVRDGKKIKPYKLDDVYLGPEFSNDEIKAELLRNNVQATYYKDIEGKVAELIAKSKVVARFNGRMEYGPRALGNRSILYKPTDRKVNDWLNKRLGRCYDDETEILTSCGWKFMKDLSKDELVATLNPKNNKLDYQKILDYVSYKFKGDMYKLKSDSIDLVVTPRHNLYVKNKTSNKFELMKIEDVCKIKSYHYHKTGGVKWIGRSEKCFVLHSMTNKNKMVKSKIKFNMDLWLEFFGYWLAEGCIYKDRNDHYRVCIVQSRKSKYFGNISKCISKFNYDFTYDKDEFIIRNKQLYTYLLRFGKAMGKFIPSELLMLNKRQLKILFNSLMKDSGSIRGVGYKYVTTSTKLADQVQILAIKLGYSARISIQKLKNIKNNYIYTVQIEKSDVITVKFSQISKTRYDGMVYCVTVPNHIIFVRRKGKPVFCGNTEFMPFAPVTLKEDAEKCYHKLDGGWHPGQYMTITFNVTDWFKKNCAAVTHVDGTARPQLITKEINPSYYEILKKYKKITGIPTIVNTSFNMHEEPIVCTPYDAIRSFKKGHLDYLAIGNYLVKNST